jgi:hypothetical protein
MSEARWYREKAAECGRRALDSENPTIRAGHLRDQSNWQQIAAGIEKAEAAVKLSKPD